MARQNINIGTVANDGTGDDLRVAMQKVNDNFTELYASSIYDDGIAISGNNISGTRSNEDINILPSGTGAVAFEGIKIRDNHIEATRSNDDLILSASGTGDIVVGAVRIHGTTISSDDSSKITINEQLDVTGALLANNNLQVNGNVGFYGTTPVAQASAIAFDPAGNDGSTVEDLRTTINEILVALRNLGLIAS